MAFLVFPPKPNHMPPPPFGKDPKMRMVHQLKLNDQQTEKFFELVTIHQQEMRKANEKEKELLEKYFAPLFENDQIFNEEILNQLLTQQQLKIEATKNHFQDLKGLLNENQIANYNEAVRLAIQNMLGGKQKPPHPPRDF